MSTEKGSSGGSKTRAKRTKSQTAETVEEPPPKKVRKVKAAPAPPAPAPQPREPALLGSLPLYGEELPDGGYDNIPAAARKTCAALRDTLCKIHRLKENGPESKVRAN